MRRSWAFTHPFVRTFLKSYHVLGPWSGAEDFRILEAHPQEGDHQVNQRWQGEEYCREGCSRSTVRCGGRVIREPWHSCRARGRNPLTSERSKLIAREA